MQRSTFRGLGIGVLLLAIANLNGEGASGSKKEQDFEIEGVALWECQCPAYGCPCQRNGRPTHGTCHGSDFAHISKGHYGGVRLDGLNVAMVGNLVDANSDRLFATLYLDDKATDEQRDALTRIVEAVLKIVDAENPPLRFFVGTEGLPIARSAYANRLSTWEAWEAVSNAARGEAKKPQIASL